MTDMLIPVPFHNDTLVLVDHEGDPFVAMKPIAENMGLAWPAQYTKLTEKFGAVISIIGTTGADGKQYEMVCLPLRKLPAWLYSISPDKVKAALRDRIVRYQDECDDALWAYWTQGSASRPGAVRPSIAQQLSAHGVRLRLLDKLERETNPAKCRAIHDQLSHVSRLLGLATPPLDGINKQAMLEI